MNCIVPFTKDIKFKNNIGEISSISLEHEYNINNNIVLGNFIITGSYKIHELSVNEEDFKFTIPFDLSLTEKIEEKTLSINIDDFTYKINKPDTLKINIDYIVLADNIVVKEEIFEKEPEEFKEMELNEIVEVEEIKEPENREEIKEPENREESIYEENKNAILNMSTNSDESFVSYYIHVMQDGESLDSLCKKYNKTDNDILEYNLNMKFVTGEKILIPEDEI